MEEPKIQNKNQNTMLAKGLEYERDGDWNAALAHWITSTEYFPHEIRFFLRQAGAALKTQKPELAISALDAARILDVDHTHSDLLDKLEDRAGKLRISLLRIRGAEAFDAGEFETARENFEALSVLVPDHPWAAARARIAAGLSTQFSQRLHAKLPSVRSRVFLTGCGRSGTWLLTAMLSCIPDIRSATRETPLGAFLEMPDEPKIHLVKRSHDAYLHFDRIPPEMKVLHVIRHPYDVLCSQHRDKKNYISLSRLEAEHAMYFAHIERRENACVIKYEDMVLQPDAVQNRVENFLDATATIPFRDFHQQADLDPDIVQAMHGLRPLDPKALHRWKNDPEAKTYLREIVTHSDGTLGRFAEAFGYDIDI